MAYTINSVEYDGASGPDGCSSEPIFMANLVGHDGRREQVYVMIEQDRHQAIRGLYHQLSDAYGLSHDLAHEIVRFRETRARNGDGTWHPVQIIEVKHDDLTSIQSPIDIHDLESTVRAMVDAFNRVIQNGNIRRN